MIHHVDVSLSDGNCLERIPQKVTSANNEPSGENSFLLIFHSERELIHFSSLVIWRIIFQNMVENLFEHFYSMRSAAEKNREAKHKLGIAHRVVGEAEMRR